MLNLTLALIVLALIAWRIIDPPRRTYRTEHDEAADALHLAYNEARREARRYRALWVDAYTCPVCGHTQRQHGAPEVQQ